MKASLLPLLLALAPAPPAPAPAGASQDDAVQDRPEPDTEALLAAFGALGIQLDLEAGCVGVPVAIEVRDDLLEYLLVMPHGAAHESLFSVTAGSAEVWVQSLNAALLTLGIVPGANAQWIPKDPRPTEEELRAGADPYDVVPPAGDALFLYAAWIEDGDLRFHPVEDLVRDLDRGRTLRRQRFVYIGSRTIERRSGEHAFAAALEGNLINISFFAQGNTLLTASAPECISQKAWLPNAWLLPPRGTSVLLLFSRARLDRPPARLEAFVPAVPSGGERR